MEGARPVGWVGIWEEGCEPFHERACSVSWALDRPGQSSPPPSSSPWDCQVHAPPHTSHGQGSPSSLRAPYLISSWVGRNAMSSLCPTTFLPTHIPSARAESKPVSQLVKAMGGGGPERSQQPGRRAWEVPPSAPLLRCCVSNFSKSSRGAGGGERCLCKEQMCRRLREENGPEVRRRWVHKRSLVDSLGS